MKEVRMRNSYLTYNNVITALGTDSPTVVSKIISGESALQSIEDTDLSPKPFYGSLIDTDSIATQLTEMGIQGKYTILEQRMILSLNKIIGDSGVKLDKRVGLIIATTKGNIDLLNQNHDFLPDRVYLGTMGTVIRDALGFKNEAIILSHACISGLLAVVTAKRLIEQQVYDAVFVVSGDLLTDFVISGFNSFQALSDKPCKPYAKDRNGINIGEVVASVLVTSQSEPAVKECVVMKGEGGANDANHISGPSRTGEGLYRSIREALREASMQPNDIGFISAHGTATLFNDEMEAIALTRCGLSHIPMNSLKGYFGHTMGASGLLETIISMHAMTNDYLIASKGMDVLGVSKPIHVIRKTKKQNYSSFLKTSSGFGGCNMTAIFEKVY